MMTTQTQTNKDHVTPSTAETIFHNGNDHFDSILKDLQNATTSIDFETYLFDQDPLGDQIINAFCQAAQRGVTVRILIDGFGSRNFYTPYITQLENAGAETRIFHPSPWQLHHWSRSKVRIHFLLKWAYLFLKLNSRNHRKTCLIDDRIAYIGSINVSQKHLSPDRGGAGWRDTCVKLVMPHKPLRKAFLHAWEHRQTKDKIKGLFKKRQYLSHFRLNYTLGRRRLMYKDLLRHIQHTEKRIWITNAYFVPDHFLLKALQNAAHRQIDVRILLPSKSDVVLMPWASSAFYRHLLLAGVRIFEYLPTMLHAKTLILDDTVFVGSSNLNHRSLLHDLEVDVLLRTEAAKSQVTEQFLKDLEQSEEITLTTWPTRRPLWKRLIGRLALYMKYWL